MIPWVREKFRAKWKTSRNASSLPQNVSSSHHRDDRQLCSTSFRTPTTGSETSKKDPETTKKIKVRVLSPNARAITIHTSTNKKLIDLKHEALIEFAEDSAALPLFASDVKQLIGKYRFVRPDAEAGVHLNENLTIAQLNIVDSETLLLNVRRAQNQVNAIRSMLHIRGPRLDEIESATRDVPSVESDSIRVNINDLVMQSDIQFDVRKVLISLAQESAYVIGSGPYAARLISMLKQKLKNKRKHQTDTLQCLIDMGFPRQNALYALKVNNNIYSSALEWLIQHQSDSLLISTDNSTLFPSVSSNFNQLNNTHSTAENTDALLKIIRIYSHRETQPSNEVLNNLKEMGFAETDIKDALKNTHNNQSAACEWLCGNRSSSLMELRDGLSIDSPILKAMLESPQVQSSLNNPKMFTAYLSMLENQNALSMWLGDTDTSSVISHILRKYHEEKHILGINQFNANP